MIESATVLVLGAGASHPYGFPLGSTLREDILHLQTSWMDLSTQTRLVDHPLFKEFVTAFRQSRLSSIDSFLGLRSRFSEVGRMAIAMLLLNYEIHSRHRLVSQPQQDWYDYLWNRLADGSWSELSFKNLTVVTFNYDRSLEFFLLSAMRGAYGVTQAEAEQKLQSLKIVHVYGDLGSVLSGDARYIPYGDPVTSLSVRKAADFLKVIPEARDDGSTFQEARKVLINADAVCFLGFGFDKTNLRRLDSAKTCGPTKPTGINESSRKVVASCLGRTLQEARASANACSFRIQEMMVEGLPVGFVDGNCMDTLRRTLILG